MSTLSSNVWNFCSSVTFGSMLSIGTANAEFAAKIAAAITSRCINVGLVLWASHTRRQLLRHQCQIADIHLLVIGEISQSRKSSLPVAPSIAGLNDIEIGAT